MYLYLDPMVQCTIMISFETLCMCACSHTHTWDFGISFYFCHLYPLTSIENFGMAMSMTFCREIINVQYMTSYQMP